MLFARDELLGRNFCSATVICAAYTRHGEGMDHYRQKWRLLLEVSLMQKVLAQWMSMPRALCTGGDTRVSGFEPSYDGEFDLA
jgi:hypothetical protein